VRLRDNEKICECENLVLVPSKFEPFVLCGNCGETYHPGGYRECKELIERRSRHQQPRP